MMRWYDGMGSGMWLFMGVFWIAVLALILFLVVRLLPSSSSRSVAPAVDSPEEILDRRFARGEIDVETYQVQRAALASARGKR